VKSPNVEILNAVFTPMHEDATIDYSRIPDLFNHCINTGAQGIFLNGSTGECMSLSMLERLQLTETWIAQRKQTNYLNFKIFVHVGSCNLKETAHMASHAEAQGVDGIAMVPTFYFRPKTLEDLVEQCQYVAAAAPNTSFYYYNIPSLTEVDFPISSFLELATSRIPNFAGLKNSSNNVVEYQHCLHSAKENHSLYWGSDEAFMMVYAAGNRHYVGSTYNYMNGLYQKMLNAYIQSDWATTLTLEKEADAIYQIMSPYNGISVGKEIMRYIGVDCGPVRRPLKALTKVDSETLFQKLTKTALLQYAINNKSTALL
jgi:N-acetylneuraminate lyase